jgi:hypothetical protein
MRRLQNIIEDWYQQFMVTYQQGKQQNHAYTLPQTKPAEHTDHEQKMTVLSSFPIRNRLTKMCSQFHCQV